MSPLYTIEIQRTRNALLTGVGVPVSILSSRVAKIYLRMAAIRDVMNVKPVIRNNPNAKEPKFSACTAHEKGIHRLEGQNNMDCWAKFVLFS